MVRVPMIPAHDSSGDAILILWCVRNYLCAVRQVEQGVAADRGQSSRRLALSKERQGGQKGLAGAYRQRLQLFLQVRQIHRRCTASILSRFNGFRLCVESVEVRFRPSAHTLPSRRLAYWLLVCHVVCRSRFSARGHVLRYQFVVSMACLSLFTSSFPSSCVTWYLTRSWSFSLAFCGPAWLAAFSSHRGKKKNNGLRRSVRSTTPRDCCQSSRPTSWRSTPCSSAGLGGTKKCFTSTSNR